ncbi:unnamed protein product [Adineta ricciae]|uniref:Uncharacterized protein n=1 Tax=Adineta ricciae TaxID=249248 RepID=A0A815M966_ADIRI|nr:unnamed protein product [Adineta ricciae]
MSLTFECLPDEIIMKFSGDVFDILRMYLSLNERFNHILLDQRLHLLTDFLHINLHHENVDHYYSTHAFRKVSKELISVVGLVTDQQLCQCVQPLIGFHLRERYNKFGEEFRSNAEHLQNVRQQYSHVELLIANSELKRIFTDLQSRSLGVRSFMEYHATNFTKSH